MVTVRGAGEALWWTREGLCNVHAMTTVRRRVALTATLIGALAASILPTASTAHAAGPGCRTVESTPLDREQARTADPRTAALTERGGFGDFVARFPAALCSTRNADEAGRLLDAWGGALWRAGVDRAQGRRPGGDLPTTDDRPLYWTRVAMTVRLARWQPGFTVDPAALRQRFEDASRGLADSGFSGRQGVRRIFISGFDPFGLDAEPRRANPSGSAALQLDGRRITLADGTPAEVRSVLFPVRYGDFDRGIVERAYAPKLTRGPAPRTSSPPSARATPGCSPWRPGPAAPAPPTPTPTTSAPSPAAPGTTPSTPRGSARAPSSSPPACPPAR